jgi:hypothetical protein
MATGRPFDLPYSVEQWDDADSHVEELIALTGDYRVARAAFEEAVKRRPGVASRQPSKELGRRPNPTPGGISGADVCDSRTDMMAHRRPQAAVPHKPLAEVAHNRPAAGVERHTPLAEQVRYLR